MARQSLSASPLHCVTAAALDIRTTFARLPSLLACPVKTEADLLMTCTSPSSLLSKGLCPKSEAAAVLSFGNPCPL
eukprot:1999116-Alexandrium_andersonii.AAC.1